MFFSTSTTTSLLATLLAAMMLTACGGGGSTTTAAGTDASDKYVGTWKRCNVYQGGPLNGFLDYSDRLVITKVGAASYNSAGAKFDHTDAQCTSAGTPIIGDTGATVFTITGTKAVTPYTVDTLTYPVGASLTAKDIAYVNLAGPTLQVGSSSGGVDAAGYPNALEGNRFVKL